MTTTATSPATLVHDHRRPLPFGKDIEVFYDGDCPLCLREIRWLRNRDKLQRVQFTDINAEGFRSEETGKTYGELMSEIHGRLPNGEVIVGMEVFRRLYQAVGLGWLVSFTAWPGVRPLADMAYQLFAKNRLRLTGRCSPETGCALKSGDARPTATCDPSPAAARDSRAG